MLFNLCKAEGRFLIQQLAVSNTTVETLADGGLTTLILVTRPETAPFKEAERVSGGHFSLG